MNSQSFELVLTATKETIIMVLLSGLLASIFGILLAVLLYVTKPSNAINDMIRSKKTKVFLNVLNSILSWFVNILRSFPFIILIILLMPFTRKIVGTAIGMKASIIPLAIAAVPLVARLTESAFCDVDQGLIQAARVMGSSNARIVFFVIIPECYASICDAITLTLINLIGYCAMAGVVGAGGLGDLAVRYGYQRFRSDIMLLSVVAIIVLVEIIQALGNFISKRIRDSR